MEEVIQKIEGKRDAFMALYKKYRSINTILMAIFVISFVPVMIWVMPIETYGTYIALGIVLLFVAVLFFYGNFMKRKTTTATLEYINDYYQAIDQYVFDETQVDDYYQFTDEQMELQNVVDARIIKGIDDLASRNTVKYRLGKFLIHSADIVAYIHHEVKRKTQKQGVFYGKFIISDNKQTKAERTIIYLKPRIELVAQAGGPTDVEDLNMIHDDKEFAVYSSSPAVLDVISKDALNLLAKFPLNEDLIDATISIQAGKTCFALSFSERIMVVPYNQPANGEAIENLKKAIETCHQFLRLN